jgi:hypothetical protein
MMNRDSKAICLFLVTLMVGFWTGGLLLWILPLPNEMTWWAIPWIFTVSATGILAAVITVEVLTKAHIWWRSRK